MREILRRVIPWLLLAGLCAFCWNLGYKASDAKWTKEVHNEYVKKDEARKDKQAGLDEISEKYQADIAGIEGSTDRIIADLNRDNERLRVKVKPTSGTSGPDGRCVFDGKAELDEATSRRLIGITQKGDAQIEALQATIRKLQNKK